MLEFKIIQELKPNKEYQQKYNLKEVKQILININFKI